MNGYVENFKSDEDILREYNAPKGALDGAQVLLAWYGYGSYSGYSLVIFIKDGKLFEVNGSHCSCNGLADQWKPEETTWDALAMRKVSDGEYAGSDEAQKILDDLITKESGTAPPYFGNRMDDFCTKRTPWHFKTECAGLGCKRIAEAK